MQHFACAGCHTSMTDMSICETDGCTSQWEMMTECDCTDGQHGAGKEALVVTDANGNILSDGDSVALIKDLTLRGTSQVIKRGTKAKGIRLTESPEEIDCKIDGTAIVLRTEFVKKL
ncbi:hypothetical protein COW46_01275 [Candidatus Gracilibacteria bacterium CG17_big_fil_post_rev_8_21_14_2_50_48_13]|nr:MAG: hypothetical protein COW46_01275 [Candidatus Gracilibacteria bacterium CG17_big_fil_post_rev_8_21_14_2_50_48_13]